MLNSGIRQMTTAESVMILVFLLSFFASFIGLLVFSILEKKLFFTVLSLILLTGTFFALAGHILMMRRKKTDEEKEHLLSDDEGADYVCDSNWGTGDPFTPDAISHEFEPEK